ncbi:hypothetical protein M3649_03885 [Ureibacillus chungkukjangi]|uniref:hypothetical protein n=1 Tax=Ureibacillus chungkukjangi TaxID=1202712 RepID=UPI00203F8822|nr:hypothetical protein [Ureibacillus chungkukjangi]MCM3387272.1 hypothetical protein [Ureibacillus chungkukjangi]
MKLKVAGLVLAMGTILGLCMVFLPNESEVGANSDWTNEVLTEANVSIGNAGFNKKEELKGRSVTESVKSTLNPMIEEEKKELEQMLEDYYNLQLQGLTDTEEYRILETKIEALKQSIFNRYKSEIDLLFK